MKTPAPFLYLLVACSFVVTGVLAVIRDSVASAQSEEVSVATRTLTVTHQAEDQVSSPPTVDELATETLLTLQLVGFRPDTTGRVVQCVYATGPSCANELPVRFDDDGRATFQYLVTSAVGAAADGSEPCRLGGARCTVEISDDGGTTVVDTVFVDAAPPPGRIDVIPDEGLIIGQQVTVTASRFPPGAELAVVVCAAPAQRGPRCGAPGPVEPLTIGLDGRADTTFTLDVIQIGTDRIACGRRVRCQVVALSDEVGVRARPVGLSFTDAPGADYVPIRVAAGLTLAAGLVIAAAWLVRRTDWDPPREADSSSIDDAELADLDEEVARFGEREADLDSAHRSEP